jgi:hypothetical protein
MSQEDEKNLFMSGMFCSFFLLRTFRSGKLIVASTHELTRNEWEREIKFSNHSQSSSSFTMALV